MARWKYRKRKRNRGRWTTPLIAVALACGWYFFEPKYVSGEWVTVSAPFGTCGDRGRPFHCVSDGDTVTIGFGANARRIRITGFDAPEVKGQCAAESAQAVLAQRALTEWLNAGPFDWDGGDTPPRDQYGRELREVRRITADGSTDALADHMIDQGLASGDGPFEWRSWCD